MIIHHFGSSAWNIDVNIGATRTIEKKKTKIFNDRNESFKTATTCNVTLCIIMHINNQLINQLKISISHVVIKLNIEAIAREIPLRTVSAIKTIRKKSFGWIWLQSCFSCINLCTIFISFFHFNVKQTCNSSPIQKSLFNVHFIYHNRLNILTERKRVRSEVC